LIEKAFKLRTLRKTRHVPKFISFICNLGLFLKNKQSVAFFIRTSLVNN
jgi:hypothetical protein